MKKYLFSVLFSFTFVPLSAQTYNMKIVKKVVISYKFLLMILKEYLLKKVFLHSLPHSMSPSLV